MKPPPDAVLAAHPVLDVVGCAQFLGRFALRQDALAAVRMEPFRVARISAHVLRRVEPEQSTRARRVIHRAGTQVMIKYAGLDRVDHEIKQFALLRDFILRRFARTDVEDGAGESCRHAGRIERGDPAPVHPQIAAIRTAQPVFTIEVSRLVRKMRVTRCVHPHLVIGVKQIAVRHQICQVGTRREPQHFVETRGKIGAAGWQLAIPHARLRGLVHQFKQFTLLRQLIGKRLRFAEVGHRADDADHSAIGAPHRSSTDNHIKRMAIAGVNFGLLPVNAIRMVDQIEVLVNVAMRHF